MPCPSPCSNCERKGLPILIARYAAAYSAREAGMAELRKLQPVAPLDPRPGGVALQTALYNVRLLREGYLYLLIEREGAMPEWQGHVVNPHGYLSEFNIRHPHTAKAHPACETDMRGAAKSLVWIPDAQRVEGLWLMFHPDPVLYSRLRQIEGQRDAYMQKFDVAGYCFCVLSGLRPLRLASSPPCAPATASTAPPARCMCCALTATAAMSCSIGVA